MRGRLFISSNTHRADDGALDNEHTRPVDAIDNRERGLALSETRTDSAVTMPLC